MKKVVMFFLSLSFIVLCCQFMPGDTNAQIDVADIMTQMEDTENMPNPNDLQSPEDISNMFGTYLDMFLPKGVDINELIEDLGINMEELGLKPDLSNIAEGLSNFTIPSDYKYNGYVNPPNWSDGSCYTHQSWDFMIDGNIHKVPVFFTDDITIEPDATGIAAPWVNEFGVPKLAHTKPLDLFIADSWCWAPRSVAMNVDFIYGIIGGMGPGYFSFEIPNTTRTRLAWVQYLVFLGSNKKDPFGAKPKIYKQKDANDIRTYFTTTVGTKIVRNGILLKKTPKELTTFPGHGLLGKWWRVTELWVLKPGGGGIDHFNMRLPSDVFSSLLESIDIDTQMYVKRK